MIKAIKAYFQKRKDIKAQKAKLAEAKKYYETVRAGGLFLKYIKDDMKKNSDGISRAQRRRTERSLEKKGEFNQEIVAHYQQNIENILTYIRIQEIALEAKINKKTAPTTKK